MRKVYILMDILVGYTGFVGSNILAKHKFDGLYNSKNIEEAFGTKPDLCVYSGVSAEKFLANKEPEKDMEGIKGAIENIKKIAPKKLVLISTIDVYKQPYDVDENTEMNTVDLQPYGLNRYYLEEWVRENVEDYHIIRLTGLFGKNLKKNFIYDLINYIPSMLNEVKYSEFSKKENLISKHYIKQDNGFYKCFCDNKEERVLLKECFKRIGFSALNFTDSRTVFQLYNLAYLWSHIEIALKKNIRLLNLTVEPVSVNEIYQSIYNEEFVNEILNIALKYDAGTIHSKEFSGLGKYIFSKEKVLGDIKTFIESMV